LKLQFDNWNLVFESSKLILELNFEISICKASLGPQFEKPFMQVLFDKQIWVLKPILELWFEKEISNFNLEKCFGNSIWQVNVGPHFEASNGANLFWDFDLTSIFRSLI
jgi:hypothetical protein